MCVAKISCIIAAVLWATVKENNADECVLSAVKTNIDYLAKIKSIKNRAGSWMKDSHPISSHASGHYWMTKGYASPFLYEFRNREDLLYLKPLAKHNIGELATGTGGVIYKGSYYFHRQGTSFIVRYNLKSKTKTKSQLSGLGYADCPWVNKKFQSCQESERRQWLYNIPHNYVDFAVDDTWGLMVVYHHANKQDLVISKLDEDDLHTEATWIIPSDKTVRKLQNTFIVCGVLYGLTTKGGAAISFAWDLYTNESINPGIEWRNPAKALVMLQYNPWDHKLYFMDDGRMGTVDVRTRENKNKKHSSNKTNFLKNQY